MFLPDVFPIRARGRAELIVVVTGHVTAWLESRFNFRLSSQHSSLTLAFQRVKDCKAPLTFAVTMAGIYTALVLTEPGFTGQSCWVLALASQSVTSLTEGLRFQFLCMLGRYAEIWVDTSWSPTDCKIYTHSTCGKAFSPESQLEGSWFKALWPHTLHHKLGAALNWSCAH